MYIVKRIFGFLMMAAPFVGAFYVTKQLAGLEASLFIWGGCFAGLLYFLIAIILLFSQPKSKEEDVREDISYLNSKVSELEILVSGIQNASLSKKDRILEWKRLYPEGTKSQCAEETGISMSTIYRYWH